MIKTLIFDMGGVLVDLDLDACRQDFINNLEYKEIDSILDACHQKGIFIIKSPAVNEGLIPPDAFVKNNVSAPINFISLVGSTTSEIG